MRYLNFKRAFLVWSFLLLLNCKSDPTDYVTHIEGYWEIESVILENGNQKDYTFSNTIDYISLTDSLKGFRKKLSPNIDGTFKTSNSSESFVLKFENDNLNMYYKTPFDNWKETVRIATVEKLQVVNENGIIYNYKRYQPINID